MVSEAWNNGFFAETLPYIRFHTLSLMNSIYPSTIWDNFFHELRSHAREVFRVWLVDWTPFVFLRIKCFYFCLSLFLF